MTRKGRRKKWNPMSLIIFLIPVCGGSYVSKPIIRQEQGILLNPEGIIAGASKMTHASLYIKIQKPRVFEGFSKTCQKICDNQDYLDESFACLVIINDGIKMSPTNVTEISKSECAKTCIRNSECKMMKSEGTLCQTFDELYGNSKRIKEITKKGMVDAECARTRLRSSCEISPTSQLNSILASDIQQEVDTFWADKQGQINELFPFATHENRKKRSVVVEGALSAIGTAVNTGFTLWETSRIQSKIDEHSVNFRKFANKMLQSEARQIQMNNEVLQIVHKLESNVDTAFSNVQCHMNALTMNFIQDKLVRKFKEKVNALTNAVNLGKRSTGISPEMFHIKELKQLVNGNAELNSSLYGENISWIYATGKITLVEFAEEDSSISLHMVLSLPMLKKSQVFHYYKTQQTGFRFNQSCWKVDLPNLVFKDAEGKFRKVDESTCNGELIKFCFENKERNESTSAEVIPSLSDNFTREPELIPVKCRQNTIYNQIGVLALSTTKVKAVLRKIVKNNKVVTWSPEEPNTRWFDWKTYSHIELDDGIIYANEFNTEIETFSIKNVTAWQNALIRAHDIFRKTDKNEAIKVLKVQLEKIKEKQNVHKKSTSSSTYGFWAVNGILALILMISAPYILRRIKMIKKGYRAINGPENIEEKKEKIERFEIRKEAPQTRTYLREKFKSTPNISDSKSVINKQLKRTASVYWESPLEKKIRGSIRFRNVPESGDEIESDEEENSPLKRTPAKSRVSLYAHAMSD